MLESTQNDFTCLAIAWIKEHQQAGNSAADGEITQDTDLIATGVLDSQGFIDLFLFLETRSGCKIDLTDVEPSEFSTVRGLCRSVLVNHDGVHAHARIA